MTTSPKIKKELYNAYSDVFSGIGYFKGTFLLQVKEDAIPLQAPSTHVVYVLQEPFKK